MGPTTSNLVSGEQHRMSNTYVTDITHYLDKNGELAEMPGEARKLASFLVLLIERHYAGFSGTQLRHPHPMPDRGLYGINPSLACIQGRRDCVALSQVQAQRSHQELAGHEVGPDKARGSGRLTPGHHADTTGAVSPASLLGHIGGEWGISQEWQEGLTRPEVIEKALQGFLGGCELIEESEEWSTKRLTGTGKRR